MAINKRLLVKPPSTGITPSEHFGVVLYEGDGSTSHSINGGKFGAGGYFNGSSSAIVNTSFGISGNQARSYSAWVYTNGSTLGTICGVGNNGVAGQSMYLFINQSTSTWSMWGYTATYDLQDQSLAAIGNLSNGWHHFVLTWDASSTFKLYIDGSLADTKTKAVTYNTPAEFAIGRWYDAGYWFNSKIDQVRIFQKALSSSEVSTLYAETVETSTSLDPLSEDTTDTLQVLGDSSCIATYRFENNEDDLSGSYDLTGNEIQYAAGRYGQAASFNGSSSYAQITSSPPQPSSGILSASVWVKSSSTSRQEIFLFEISSGGSGIHEYLSLENFGFGGTNSIRCVYNNSQVTNTNNEAVSDDLWHHFVVSVGSSTLKVYKDGSEIASGSITATQKTVLSLNVGFRGYNTDLYFNGEIDQFRIFNKELSASEVTTLYNENSLVASYRFEGNANDDMRAYDGTASDVTYEYGLNFTPDFVWLKGRTNTENHSIYDNSRPLGSPIYPNLTLKEGTGATHITSLDTGGFTLGTTNHNANGQDYVGWCLKANGGTTSSNTDGSITSTVQANEDAGFSIISYTGNGISGATIGHGLSVAPEIIITKNLSAATDWITHTTAIDGSLDFLYLNTSNAKSNSSLSAPTSTVFSRGSAVMDNTSGNNYICYAFASTDSFSKFGSYTGTGAAGKLIETGFEPAFLIIKRATDAAGDWRVYDNKRNLTNPRNNLLKPNSNVAEETNSSTASIDFLSNGFKLNSVGTGTNASGSDYIYMAFAADPDTEAPTVAKSFSTVAYTGDGTANRVIDELGFKPGLYWLKTRDTSGCTYHNLFDIIRGGNKTIYSNATLAEVTDQGCGYISSFDDNGVTYTADASGINNSGEDFVAWAWKADDNEPTIYGGPAIAVYKFEDNANDVTTDYNGTATNVTYSSSGKFNKAASFNGTSSVITLPSALSDGSTTDANCISFWFNVGAEVTSSTANNEIMNFAQSSSNFGKIALGSTTGNFTGETFSVTSDVTNQYTYSKTNIPAGWNHAVVQWNSSNSKWDIYINGVAHTTYTFGTNEQGKWALKFGNRSSFYYTGKLDQVRIYKGVLAQEQVTELYNETASDNDDLTLGAPPKSIVSANANAGMSIVKWQGSGGNAQIPHGLSAAPEMIITKRLNGANDWWTYNKDLNGGTNPASYFIKLNSTDAEILNSSGSVFQGTSPTSTVFYVGNSLNASTSDEYIAYCFHSVSGYSKIGSYTGSSSTVTVTVGFQLDFLMIKRSNGSNDWIMYDTVRSGSTSMNDYLVPNKSDAEYTNTSLVINVTSTGFTIASGLWAGMNASGGEYIYMAFKIN